MHWRFNAFPTNQECIVSDLNIFSFNQRQVRVVQVQGEPWFVAADVAQALEYRMASDMTRILDSDERGTRNVRTPSGIQEMSIISEPGLYSAIFRSRSSEAKRFKRWVTHEVLPAIRKTGRYEQPQPPARRPVGLIVPRLPEHLTRHQRQWVNSTANAMGAAFAREARVYLLNAIAEAENPDDSPYRYEVDLAEILAYTSLMDVARYYNRRLIAAERAQSDAPSLVSSLV